MKKLLITGFSPFGKITRNPSAELVKRLMAMEFDNLEVRGEILSTSFAKAGDKIRELLEAEKPDAVICLGVAQNREAITPERFALNVNEASIPDNDGVVSTGDPIREDGPAAYRTGLPLMAMIAAMAEADIPAKASNHAGAYVCNHVFYTLMDVLAQSGREIPAGFIHIPMASDYPDQPGADKGLLLEQMTRGLALCIELLQNIL